MEFLYLESSRLLHFVFESLKKKQKKPQAHTKYHTRARAHTCKRPSTRTILFKATVQTQTSLLRHFAFPLSSQIHHLLLNFFNTRGYYTNLAQSTSIQSNSLLHEKVFISALHIQVTQFSFLVSTRFFTNRPHNFPQVSPL